MPLLFSKQINPYSAYAVWHITETESQLLEKIKENPEHSNPNKKSEWIVTRILIRYLCSLFDLNYHGMGNHESGKPFLIDQRAEISISHSFPVAACLINTRKPCGIDIELPREKLRLVSSKFLHSEEARSDDLAYLCKIWTAKEALYKSYGEANLSMQNEMKISLMADDRAEGLILKEGFEKKYVICFEDLFRYTMAYTI